MKITTKVCFYFLHKKKVPKLGKVHNVKNVNVDKIKTLAKEQGKTMKFLCDLLGKDRSFLTCVRNGNNHIDSNELQIIADELRTTVEYLTDKTDQKEKPTADNSGELNKNVERVLDKLMKMHPEDLEKTIAFAEWLAAQRDE